MQSFEIFFDKYQIKEYTDNEFYAFFIQVNKMIDDFFGLEELN